MNIKSCLYFLGLSFFPISLMSLINIFYSLYFNYLKNVNSYLITLILTLVVGLAFFYLGRKEKENINIYEQLFLIFLVFFFLFFFISIPFYLSSYNLSFINSYFEAVSGLTGTGFSTFEYIKSLDSPLILWRSSSQWIGGLYFLIFLVLIFSNKQMSFKMINLTFSLENKINFSSNLFSVTNRIFLIYLSLSILIFSLFLFSGIRLFDSLNLSMTVVSSGGFLPTDTLNDIIKTDLQSIFLCFAFLVSFLNFYLFYNFFLERNNLKYHTEDLYLVILAAIFSIIFYFLNSLNVSSVLVNILSSLSNSGISMPLFQKIMDYTFCFLL